MEDERKKISVTFIVVRTEDLVDRVKLREALRPEATMMFEATALVPPNAEGDYFDMHVEPAIKSLLWSVRDRLIKED